MYISTSNNSFSNYQKKLPFSLALAFLLALSIIILLSTLEIKDRYYVLIILAPLFLLIILNFKLSISVLIISLFINLNFFYFSISELIVLFLVLSFLLTHKFEFREFNNKLLVSFGIFILSLIPSYYNLLSNTIEALPLSLHLVFFVLIFSIVSASINNYHQIRDIIILFLALSLVNGLFVIASALLTGKRVFGFSGIMYVDYVGYSIVMSFIFLMLKRSNKLLNLILLSIFSIALIFTQTRSIWVVTGVTLFLIFFHFILKGQKYQLSRLKLSFAFISIIFILGIFTMTLRDVNKDYFERVEIKKIEHTDDPMRQTLQINSLISRYFIWSVAWETFIHNPVVGVGIYAFPFVSKAYSNLEPILYEMFVEKQTQHETFLAILSECGVIGFSGFMFFLFSTIIFAINNYKASNSDDEIFYSEIILWLTIYTLLSMIITDAWLWGHGIILWGILLGVSIANRKILGSSSGKMN